MFVQSMVSQHENSPNSRARKSETCHQRSERMKKMKNIRKQKVTAMRLQKIQESLEKDERATKQQRKEMQKKKNRMAAQISRDRQKKYLESLETQINQMEKIIEDQICRKCRGPLSDHPTSQDGHSSERMQHKEMQVEQISQNFISDDPQVESLPFIRVPFEKNEMSFGKFGSFFCLCMLLLAVFCFSNAINGQETTVNEMMTYGKGRILQEANICDKTYQNMYNLPHLYSQSLQNPLQTHIEWPIFEGNYNISSEQQCKNDFWDSYLNQARNELAVPFIRTYANCFSPSLVRITSVANRENEIIDDSWTMVISNPKISHAHFTERGEFRIDEVNQLNGVYEMVGQNVIIRKVIGDNCFA